MSSIIVTKNTFTAFRLFIYLFFQFFTMEKALDAPPVTALQADLTV